jgi:hypothetical protein
MRIITRLAAVLLTLSVALIISGTASAHASGGQDPAPAAEKTPSPPPGEIMPQDVGVLLAALPCVAGGPAAADGAMAAALNPQLTNKMRGNMNAYNASCARAVVQRVRSQGLNERAAAIAVATTIVETSIANLDGGDRDSVGLFQQRAIWGTFAERTNPVIATQTFLREMQRIYPNNSWNTAPIGDVAANVQKPAAQYRYRYGVEANDAVKIAHALWSDPPLHVLTLAGGNLYSNARWPDGSWNGANLADGNGSITDVAAAAMPNGDLHVLTVAGGKLYSNARWANGTWNGASLVDGNGSITAVAAAAMPNGDLHVLTLVGGKLYSNARWANGTWNGASLVDGSGSITDVAAAGMPNGDLHVLTLADGKLYSNARWANGSWNGAALADGNGSITRVAAAGMPNGDLHVLTLVGGKLYSNARWANGSWNGASLVDANGSITALATAD